MLEHVSILKRSLHEHGNLVSNLLFFLFIYSAFETRLPPELQKLVTHCTEKNTTGMTDMGKMKINAKVGLNDIGQV